MEPMDLDAAPHIARTALVGLSLGPAFGRRGKRYLLWWIRAGNPMQPCPKLPTSDAPASLETFRGRPFLPGQRGRATANGDPPDPPHLLGVDLGRFTFGSAQLQPPFRGGSRLKTCSADRGCG